MSKTIAAIATAQAPAGIGIVRISGDSALAVALRVFHGANKCLSDMDGYTAAYGHIVYEGNVIDEAIATVFKAPHSYTGEDVVELSCHGGIFILKKVLRAVLASGASLAEPGEFTKRAFLNGKLGLTQAEAVMDMIGAQGEQSSRAALAVRDGAVARRISAVKDKLIEISSHMAAWVDYPEEDIPELSADLLKSSLLSCSELLSGMLNEFDLGKLIREGVSTAIVGKPNVGKSTLMNLLSGTKRSIVTEIAGTTRDIVEETVNVGDIILRLSDTAGIRSTDDVVESIGVQLAMDKIDESDLILAVFDGSVELDDDDISVLEKIKDRNSVIIINKLDLPLLISEEKVREYSKNVILMSATSDDALETLECALKKCFDLDKLNPSEGILSTERQRDCCVRALDHVNEALNALELGLTFDAVNVCVDSAIDSLLELTGEKAANAVVDAVFARFCVGK